MLETAKVNKVEIPTTIIKMADMIYILEFKVDDKEIYLVGIEFSKEDKNISKFEWERTN